MPRAARSTADKPKTPRKPRIVEEPVVATPAQAGAEVGDNSDGVAMTAEAVVVTPIEQTAEADAGPEGPVTSDPDGEAYDPKVADNPAAPDNLEEFIEDYLKTHGPPALVTSAYMVEPPPVPEGPRWERAAELFADGRLPAVEEMDAYRKEFRLSGDEWHEVRNFFLHPRDTGAPVHRGRHIPHAEFYTKDTPEGPAPTGGFAMGDGYEIVFQNGVEGVAGAIIEDIIEYALIPRLEFFQASRFACMENGMAIQFLRRAVEALDLRTQRRKTAGTEGSYRGT